MNIHASPLRLLGAETTLAAILDALGPHDDKTLTIEYGDGTRVQAGYHVTEVKAGSFVALDCGGNPDAWQETILQVEDIPAAEGNRIMTVGKFRSILAQVDRKVRLAADARLTLEVSRPDEAMRIFDIAAVEIGADSAIVRLGQRPAICKPRHRAAQATVEAAQSCAPSDQGSSCCA
jgi:hypothetical protein